MRSPDIIQTLSSQDFRFILGLKLSKTSIFSGLCIFFKAQVAARVAKAQLVCSLKPCQLVQNSALTVRFKEINLTAFWVEDYHDFLASITSALLSVL